MPPSNHLNSFRSNFALSAAIASKAGPIIFVLIASGVLAICCLVTGIRFIIAPTIWLGVAVLFSVSFIYARGARSLPISEMAYFGALWVCLTAVGVMFTYLAATLQYPLFDTQFSKLDGAVGFEWLVWYQYIESNRVINLALGLAYATGVLQIIGAIFYFAHTKRSDRNRELWWVAIISLLLTAGVSGILPAMGTFHYHNIGLERAVHLSDLLALRDGSKTTFHIQQMQGIITLPSYHTVLAIVFIYVFRGIPIWFFVSMVLNILMLISTPSHGGHYLVDMIAGAAVAFVTIFLVRQLKRLSDSHVKPFSTALAGQYDVLSGNSSSKTS